MNFKIEDAPNKFVSLSQIIKNYEGQLSSPSIVHKIKLDIQSCLRQYIKTYVITCDDINVLKHGEFNQHITIYFSDWLTKVIYNEYPELLY